APAAAGARDVPREVRNDALEAVRHRAGRVRRRARRAAEADEGARGLVREEPRVGRLAEAEADDAQEGGGAEAGEEVEEELNVCARGVLVLLPLLAACGGDGGHGEKARAPAPAHERSKDPDVFEVEPGGDIQAAIEAAANAGAKGKTV